MVESFLQCFFFHFDQISAKVVRVSAGFKYNAVTLLFFFLPTVNKIVCNRHFANAYSILCIHFLYQLCSSFGLSWSYFRIFLCVAMERRFCVSLCVFVCDFIQICLHMYIGAFGCTFFLLGKLYCVQRSATHPQQDYDKRLKGLIQCQETLSDQLLMALNCMCHLHCGFFFLIHQHFGLLAT